MKSFWKKTKKNVTLGVAKAKDGLSSDQKKKEKEEPEYIEQYDHLKLLQEQCVKLTRALNNLSQQLYNTASSLITVSSAFNEIIPVDAEPYHTHALKAKDGTDRFRVFTEYLKNHYVPQNEINMIKLCQEQISQLKVIKDKRKKNRVLLQQEEAHLAQAKAKNKEVQVHEEKTRLRREKYERYHNDFINGVSRLFENRMNYFGKVYQVYQFYMLELIGLQKIHLVKTLTDDFPLEQIREVVPSLTIEPDFKKDETAQNDALKSGGKKEGKPPIPSSKSQPGSAADGSPFEKYELKEFESSSDLSDDLYPVPEPEELNQSSQPQSSNAETDDLISLDD